MTRRGNLPWSVYRRLRFPSRFVWHLVYEDEAGNERTVRHYLSERRALRAMRRRNGIS